EEEKEKSGKLTLSNVLSKAKQAANYIKNEMSDEEKEETLDFAEENGLSMSDAKKIVSKVSSMDVEDLEQVKDTVAESYIIHEGFGRKVASRL
ncbi:hypothetical protein, partial [Escherichia coli]|uniref:hypothetical protein n=1 Tax=Escherichia coli TaxID=562 RepID=UPI00200EDFB7